MKRANIQLLKLRGRVLCLAYALAAVSSLALGATQESGQTVIRVFTDRPIVKVNHRVLGNNIVAYKALPNLQFSAQGAGLWNPVTNHPVNEMVSLARASGTSTLRWPGGCGVHEFNWKLSVGPREARQRQVFGLPEFLRLASDLGADPVITIADYFGEAKDAADLVEYLNAPLGTNVNGGVAWAAVRAADGHPEPYGIKWFEFGNESSHGPHQTSTDTNTSPRRYSPSEYSQRYRAFRSAMKAVDSTIQLGAVTDNDTSTVLSNWTRTIVKETGDIADFLIHHAYLPIYSLENGDPSPNELYKIAFAAPRQFDAVFKQINELVRNETGRQIPLAITEYNGHFVQDDPVPYRWTLGTAVEVADLIQVMLDPGNKILHGQYWLLSNEYWGMIKGLAPPYVLRPAYHVFSLYHAHIGDQLLVTTAEGDGYEQSGGFGVVPSRGMGSRFELIGLPQPILAKWQIDQIAGAAARLDTNSVLGVDITATSGLNYHHSRIKFPAASSTGYRVTGEMRAEGLTRTGAHLEVGDARGWRMTKSSASSEKVNGSKWTAVVADYVTLSDTKDIEIVARRLGQIPERGQFWLRNLRVQRFQPFTLPKIPYVGVMATRTADTVAVFLINRRIGSSSPVRIVLPEAVAATGWTLAGPAVDSTNESNPNNVNVRELAVESSGKAILANLPPHSFSVIKFAVSPPAGTKQK